MTAQDTRDKFVSLDDLQTSHLELTQKFLYGGASLEKDWQEVERFVAKARTAGAILSDDADRDTAQNLIDDWVKKLIEVKKEIRDTELLPFKDVSTYQVSSSHSVTSTWVDGKPNFPSLLALQTAHADLNKRCRDGATVRDDVWQEVKVFIAKGKATGALLADDNERYAAQSLLDYWATMLYRYKQESPDTTLLPFDESSVTELTDEDYPYRTLPMPPSDLVTARELRFAVEGPARAIGLVFDDGVIEALLRDVRDEADAWSLLELMLGELWQKRQRNKITWAAYQELGGVAGLLSKKAETFYGSLESSDQDITKKILLRLVRLDERQQPTSRVIAVETFYTLFSALGISREKVEGTLVKLEQARVVKREQDGSVSLFHSALLREWPKLAEWLQDESIRERLNLTAAAEQWEATGRDEGALWWGKLLTKALNYRDLDKLEQEFLEVSRQRRERRIQRRNILLSVGFASVLMLAALALVGWRYAILARRFAEAQSNIVTAFLDKQFDVALLLAVKTYQRVDEDSAQKGLLSALRYTQQAYAPFLPVRYLHGHNTEVAQVAFSDDGKVAATAASFDSEKTLTLWDVTSGEQIVQETFSPATSAISLEPTKGEARGFILESPLPLWQDLATTRAEFFTKDSKSAVSSAALSPDGQTLALGYSDGTVILWRIQTPDQPFLGHRLSGFGDNSLIRKSAFSQTGQYLALSSDPGAIALWEIADEEGKQRATIPVDKAIPRSMALSSDGQLLAWLESNNEIKLWDVQNNREANAIAPNTLDAVIHSLAFDADNQLLLGQRNGRVSRWNWQDGNLRHVNLQAFEGSILNLALSAKGTLAITDSGGFASLWRVENGEPILSPLPINGYITSLAFNASGDKLALGTRSGTIILWDVTRQEVMSELSTGAEASVQSLVFSNSEQLLSSSSDGRMMLWAVDVTALLREVCRIANPPLEAAKNEQYGDLNSVCLEAPVNRSQ